MRNRLITLIALLAGSFAIACGGAQNMEEPTETTETEVTEEEAVEMTTLRLVHAAQAATASVYAGDAELAGGLQAGDVSDLLEVPAGAHDLSVRSASGTTTLAEATVELPTDAGTTIIVGGTSESLALIVAEDQSPEPAEGHAFVRFVNASTTAGALTATADGRGYAAGVAPGTASLFIQVPAGSTTFELAGSELSATSGINLAAGSVYTLVAHTATGDEMGAFVITH